MDLASNWTQVILGVISLVGIVTTALVSLSNRRALRTSNGTTVGAQIEQTHALVKEAKEHAEHVAEALDKANGV